MAHKVVTLLRLVTYWSAPVATATPRRDRRGLEGGTSPSYAYQQVNAEGRSDLEIPRALNASQLQRFDSRML